MLAIALLVIAVAFVFLLGFRLAGQQRRELWRRAFPIALGTGAVLLLTRGRVVMAGVLGIAAVVIWLLDVGPHTFARAQQPDGPPPSEAEARSLLGVGPNASVQDIRAAHRARMRNAHPDRGGSTQLAARLNAARDLLLKGR